MFIEGRRFHLTATLHLGSLLTDAADNKLSAMSNSGLKHYGGVACSVFCSGLDGRCDWWKVKNMNQFTVAAIMSQGINT